MGFFSAEVEMALSIKEHERKKAYLMFCFSLCVNLVTYKMMIQDRWRTDMNNVGKMFLCREKKN